MTKHKEKTTTAIYYRIPARITADKIFTDGRNISQMPVFDEQECTEYIRKDLLLEWVNAMGKCSPSVELLAHELIRKINAL